MKTISVILLIVTATILLVAGPALLGETSLVFHHHAFINQLLRYQVWALLVSLLVVGFSQLITPGAVKRLKWGNVYAIAQKEKWLGIKGNSTWLASAFVLGLTISAGTAIFMGLGVYYSGSASKFSWSFMPWVILFSATNALSEELIYRYAPIVGLQNHIPQRRLLLLAAVLFGVPHYFGNPGGPVGVVMSGVLGYILMKVSIETKGFGIAWAIHFVQDVIIFTALFTMGFN